MRAQFNLAVMYYNGEGVTQDHVEAYAWFSVVAAGGCVPAEEERDAVKELLSGSQLALGQPVSVGATTGNRIVREVRQRKVSHITMTSPAQAGGLVFAQLPPSDAVSYTSVPCHSAPSGGVFADPRYASSISRDGGLATQQPH